MKERELRRMVEKVITFEKKKLLTLVDYLDIYVKHEIENDNQLGPEKKRIILNYPVVYIHTWKANSKLHVYVGETINLVRRSQEHADNNKENSWQDRWKNGTEHKSFYFSDACMNKSLALDIEDSLITILRNLSKNIDLTICNGRSNQQSGYSNKDKRDGLLYDIWKSINNTLRIINDNSVMDAGIIKTKGKNAKDLRPELKCMEIKFKVNSENDIEDLLKGKILNNGLDESVLNAYPVVYMHIWKGKDNFVHVYTGETNNLLKRTIQHYNNDTIDYGYDLQFLYEEEVDWHDDWKQAVEKGSAIMYVFSSGDMNISVTRDIENYLIRYNTILHLSVNGRRNQQREYDNRECAYPLFTKIIEYLNQRCECNKGMINMFKDQDYKFCSLDNIKELSTFMASPLLCLSQEQNEAKKAIQDQIFTSFVENENKHSLLIVNGEAGTGKTVLISSLLFDLCDSKYEDNKVNTKLFINHLELFNAYKVQADTRGLSNNIDYSSAIVKAEEWINEVKIAYLSAILPYFKEAFQKEILNDLSKKELDNKFSEGLDRNYLKSDEKTECVIIDGRSTYLWNNIKLLINWAQKNNIDLLDKKIDIALVDEAHLIKSQGSTGGIKEAQLPIIVDNSKVVVLMVDPKQFLDSGTSICEDLKELDNKTIEEKYRVFLAKYGIEEKIRVQMIAEIKDQFRMNCCDKTIEWIKSIYKEGEEIQPFPTESKYKFKTIIYEKREEAKLIKEEDIFVYEKRGNDIVYEIGIFSNRYRLCEAIEEKKKAKENPSCIVASYCWDNNNEIIFEDRSSNNIVIPYRWQSTGKGPDDKSKITIWTMEESLISKDKDNKPYIKVGSFHDIQGFDLKYAGVILGNSIKLGKKGENKNKIVFDVSNRKGISKNTSNWKQLIQNEIGVLLSRGSKGIYIYAEDDNYRKALINALKREKSL